MAKLLHTLKKTNNTHSSSTRSDEGLMLRMPAFQIFHSGNLTFTKSFDKTKFLFHSPTNTAPQFLLKIEIRLNFPFILFISLGFSEIPGFFRSS